MTQRADADVELRRAVAADYPAVGELTVAAYRTDGFLDGDEDYAATLLDVARRDREAEVYVAADDSGTVLGAVTVCSADSSYAELARDGELEVRMLAVAPAARGRGVGRRLMDEVHSLARRRGMTRIVLCSQDRMLAAHRLYERFGFARSPERDWSIGEIRLVSFALELAADARTSPAS
ncbi:GNAT family N-acetyltransferase [Actinoalloteichus hymeniacidonis]|uniref:Sortase-like acyltransferase n=1 Tax=Actinoalloteichus hymeniacidonis TaxID=340345 RepID=A0AAC9HU34_9PSEU|nr:GNAT family N-acetyltransferase [Actinoalloteichus hymeniacidonis]AOS65349.1 sortase-like acyltransferase [Actinoalloteichus hymeniacidonis]MBB5906565.1 ribosomal protein S18 acetylase RimI-like enzyme [Actinoalloteichus hymeniacidonis]